MPRTEYYGYYKGDDYYGHMPDNRVLRCETEREYHRLFDEELAELGLLFCFVHFASESIPKIRRWTIMSILIKILLYFVVGFGVMVMFNETIKKKEGKQDDMLLLDKLFTKECLKYLPIAFVICAMWPLVFVTLLVYITTR